MKFNIPFFFFAFMFSAGYAQISDSSKWALQMAGSVSVSDFYFSSKEENLKVLVNRQNELTLLGGGHQFGFTSFRKVKSDFYVGSGFQYMKRIQNIDESKLTNMLTYKNVYNWFSVPLSIKKSFAGVENHYLFTNLGFSVSYLMNAKSEYKALGMNQVKISQLSEGVNQWLISSFAQFGIQWNLKDNGFCGISACADFGINSMSTEVGFGMHPYSVGLNLFLGINR